MARDMSGYFRIESTPTWSLQEFLDHWKLISDARVSSEHTKGKEKS